MADEPQFLNDYQGGDKPAPGSSRAERLKAAGIQEGQTLADYHAQKNQRNYDRAGGDIVFVQEPVTEKSVVGHSADKKRALQLMKEDEIDLATALAKVREGSHKPTKKRGK